MRSLGSSAVSPLLLLLAWPCAAFSTTPARRLRTQATVRGGCRNGNSALVHPQRLQPQLLQQSAVPAHALAVARRSAAAQCGLLGGPSGDDEPVMAEGQRVRVIESAMLMHVPGHNDKAGFDPKGCEGTVIRQYTEANLSPNRGVKVRFEEPKKWTAHFEPWELEPLD